MKGFLSFCFYSSGVIDSLLFLSFYRIEEFV